jgi:CarboxypepD_reg-like domain
MKYAISILFLLSSLAGCKGDQGPAGPIPTGSIVGTIHLFADNGLPLHDESGALVSIEGESFSTLTSTNGSWKLAGIPAGVYTLVFSKTGFTTYKEFNFQFAGNNTYYFEDVHLGQIPSVAITQVKFSRYGSTDNCNAQGKISSADSLYRTVEIMVDTKPIAVSSTMTFVELSDTQLSPDSTSFIAEFGIYGFPSGTKVYMRAFASPRSGSYWNYDPATQAYEIFNSGFSFSNLDSLTTQ